MPLALNPSPRKSSFLAITVEEWSPFWLPQQFRAWIATGRRFGSIPLIFSLQCAACRARARSDDEAPRRLEPIAPRTATFISGAGCMVTPVWYPYTDFRRKISTQSSSLGRGGNGRRSR